MSQRFSPWLARFRPNHSQPNRRTARSERPCLEQLEERDVPSTVTPDFVLHHSSKVTPHAVSGPTGTTPAQIRQAYGFTGITFDNGTIVGDGTGTTIAIVDAYNDPNVASDLDAFDKQFGAAAAGSTLYQQYGAASSFLKVVNESGGSSLPAGNTGWAEEIALDVEWAHAIAPGAHILLVEANSSSYSDLLAGVTYAAKQSGVVAVSMSWGGNEFSGETSSDSAFQTPSGHSGVTFVVSSGDSGAPASYPATSPNVVSVGGTSLFLNGSGGISSESAWSGSGGGISSQEPQPSYQNGVVTQSTNMRTNPDVAYDADPNTGFPEYNSFSFPSSPWQQFGGTSDAAPQWAALIAIADQGRIDNGLSSLDGRSQTLPALYGLPASDFHDVTTGSSTGSPSYSAGPGYDLTTGRGSPVANLIVAALAGQASTSPTPTATHFSLSASTTSVAGTAITVTVTALSSSGSKVTSYSGAVHLTSSDLAAILPANPTLTSGVATFTVTLKTAGSQSISVADTSTGSLTGNTSVTVSPAAAKQLVFGQQPAATVAGSTISPAVTVRVLDAFGNLVTTDNKDQISLALGSNPGIGTLSGSAPVTVSGGVATFNNLSVNNAGSGYTLLASATSLTGATSGSFNITASSSGTGGSGGLGGSGGSGGGSGGGNGTSVIEGFETSDTWNIVGGRTITAVEATYAAHDGTYGLDQLNGNEWIYRSDAAAQVQAGDTLSVWLQFAGSADGRAYFGFGANSYGALSLVAAPNSGQLILQQNIFYGYTNLAAVNQNFQANHWYRLEVDWGTSGKIVGKLFDSNGTTLLQTVTASTTVITTGGIAFRATGSDKYWDTVTANYGVNNFVSHNSVSSTTNNSNAPSLSTVPKNASKAAVDSYFASFLEFNPTAVGYEQWFAQEGKSLQGWALTWAESYWSWEV
jgi:hypothetical protein